jgi:SAM-dependent methyltransferase
MTNPWDARYTGEEYFYGTEPNDFLSAQASRIVAGGRVLCLAEGEGRNAVFLAKRGFRVTAVDGSEVGLEKLRRLAVKGGLSPDAIRTECRDLNDYDIIKEGGPSGWQAVVSIWAHTPKPLRQVLHRSVAAALAPGGVFILEAYRPKQLEYKTGGPPTAELMMTLQDLKSELPGLELELAQELDREIREGKGHLGMSAVVQLVARKPAPASS